MGEICLSGGGGRGYAVFRSAKMWDFIRSYIYSSFQLGVVSPVFLPDWAVLDADLTVGLPPHVTAATGTFLLPSCASERVIFLLYI